MVEIHPKKKPLVTSLIFIFKLKKKSRFMTISKIELNFFQIDLMLELFMRFRLELLVLKIIHYE